MDLQNLPPEELLSLAEAVVRTLRQKIKSLSDYEIRKRGLHFEYIIVASGDPRGGMGTKPILLPEDRSIPHIRMPEPVRLDPIEGRAKLRLAKAPVYTIWDRFPPRNAEEREEMEKEMEKVRPKIDDPFQKFLSQQALTVSRREHRLQSEVLSDPEFRTKCRNIFDSLVL